MIRPGKMLREVLRTALRKPATVPYPSVKVKMPEHFRGRLVFHNERCVGCGMCMKDCPTKAIVIRKIGDKKFEADIDLAQCIYCAQCVDSCPKKALDATVEFELAQLDRQKLKTTSHYKQVSDSVSENKPKQPEHKASDESAKS